MLSMKALGPKRSAKTSKADFECNKFLWKIGKFSQSEEDPKADPRNQALGS